MFISVFVAAAKKAKVTPAIITVIVMMLVVSYMIYQQALLMQGNLDLYDNVVTFMTLSVIERTFKSFNEILVRRFILKPFELEATQLLTQLMVKLGPASLIVAKCETAAIQNAALEALKAVMTNVITLITPCVLLISKGAALAQVLNLMHLVVMTSCLTAVFLAGLAILAYDHHKKKDLSRNETEARERERSFIRSLASLVVNGMGTLLPSWMRVLRLTVLDPSTKHETIMEALYGLLELATVAIPIALVWILKGTSQFLPLFIVVQPMFWNAWFLFYTVKSLVVETAPFSQFTEFFRKTGPPPSNLSQPKSAAEMLLVFVNSEIREIRLYGDSGCGKSTLMKKLVSGICCKFVLGFILYIEQFPSLPLGINPLEYFSLGFNGNLPQEFMDKLFHYADRLGLTNIINQGTLAVPFRNPSGGELKRIIFLQYVLPILLGVSQVQIIFLDEVTAGLDEHTFAMVRALVDELKVRGVKVVSIDHHDYPVDLRVEVFKKIVPASIPEGDKKMPSLLRRIMQRVFPFRYHEEKEPDLEMGEGPTDIVVLAPALGMVEP